MTNFQFISLLVAVLGGQLSTIFFLMNRIDAVGARVDRIDDDLKVFYRSLGQHDSRLDSLEKQ